MQRSRDATIDPEHQLAIQFSIAHAFASAEQIGDVAPLVLQTLADAFGWDYAGLWLRDESDPDHLRCVVTHAPAARLEAWVKATREWHLSPGVGLPGRVWKSGRAEWITDTELDPNFPRRELAREAGVRHGFAFPTFVGGKVGAVIELFAGEASDMDHNQAAFLQAIGDQLGSFIERIEANRAVAASEARKTSVLSAAVDAIVSADERGRILEFNPAAEKLFGGRREDVIGRRIAEILVPDELRAAHETGLARYLSTGIGRILGQRVRTRGLRADGSHVPIELTITETRLDGRPLFTAFIRDITLEQEAEIARERFLAVLSHELRTPVTAIYGGAKVLARPSIAGEQQRELIADIGAEADRLYRLVEDLIVLARAERGAASVAMEPIRLEGIAERVIGSVSEQAPGTQMLVRQCNSPVAVHGDETYAEQLMRNLVSNAVKYGAGSAVEIDITHAVEGHTHESTVRVLDRGRGIDPDEAARLFEIDYRSPRTRGMAQGSGIGLFVARWLAESMGGRIWAAPRDGGGSEFGFALQAVRDEDALVEDVIELGTSSSGATRPN